MPDMRRFRIPDDRRPDFERLRELRPRRPRWLHGPDRERLHDRFDELRERKWRPAWLALPALEGLSIPKMSLPARLLVPGIAVILLLFGGGLYFGNLLGSDPSAAGTGLITTVTVKGEIVTTTVKGKVVKVRVPARTKVITKRKTKRLPRSTDILTSTQVRTQTRTQQVPVPTTIIRTVTTTRTVTQTVTGPTTTVTVPST
jgi:hypothetical protein